jgi:biotin carboxylase
MTLATDMPMRSVARVAEVCGIAGISMDTAIKTTDKGEMITVFEYNGIEHPWYFIATNRNEFENIKHNVTYPCIMKPTDNAGSRGVVLVNNLEELENKYEYAVGESRKGGVIIEEYMLGPEVSVEVMVVNGDPHILQVTDKITTGAPHFVEMGHTQPSRLGKESVASIHDLAIRAIKAVAIKNGPAHVEIILTKDGPKMVELGARMGGDCITTHLVPLSTGVIWFAHY